MPAPDFHLGDKAKASIGTTRIKGLNALTVPGIDRNTVEIVEFEKDFDFTVPTSAKWTEGSISGNYVRGDDDGQRALREKLFANEGLADLRLYEDEADFWACDLANDPASQIFIKSMPGPDVSKSGVIAFSATLLVQGLLALYTAHAAGTGIAFVQGDGAADTITDAGSGFVEAGFKAGMSLIIENSPGNDAVSALITEVAAGVLTLSTEGVLTAESGTATTAIHGGRL